MLNTWPLSHHLQGLGLLSASVLCLQTQLHGEFASSLYLFFLQHVPQDGDSSVGVISVSRAEQQQTPSV